MNTPKASKLARPIILIILVVLLTGVIGFAVGGWSTEDESPTKTIDTQVQNNIEQPQENTDIQEEIITLDYLTGLPIDKTEADKIPMAFLFDSAYTSYGIGYAQINMEIPVENGKTRYLSYIRETDKLGKIGTLSSSRSYINAVCAAFGGTLFFAGYDDVLVEDTESENLQKLNVLGKTGYAYIENDKEIYSNPYMVNTAMNDFGLRTSYAEVPTLPFSFSATEKTASLPAKSVILPFTADNKTEFQYKDSTGTYTWLKNGSAVSDPLTYGDIEYKNVLILFADATTYETIDYTQMLLKTTENGTGYYLTNGTYERISFSSDSAGNIMFSDTSGRKLSVNTGKTYIGFFKSSQKNAVKIG